MRGQPTLPNAPSSAALPLEIFKVAGSIGAEIRGIDISGDLDADTIAQIRAALL